MLWLRLLKWTLIYTGVVGSLVEATPTSQITKVPQITEAPQTTEAPHITIAPRAKSTSTSTFTTTWGVTDSTEGEFLELIRNLRRVAHNNGPRVQGLPLLRSLGRQERQQPRFIDITLVATWTGWITIRMRPANGYIIGHQVDQTWYELPSPNPRGEPERRIPGSTYLGFGGDYPDLVRKAGLVVTPKSNPNANERYVRTGIMMGRDALLAAVLTLLSGTEASVQDQANAYLVIIQMIAEAMRFDSILNHLTLVDPRRGISTHWRSGTYLTRDMVTMQNHWKTVSDAVLYHAQADNTESERQLVRVNNQLQVRLTFQQFLQIIGVLLWSNNQKGYRPNAPGPSGMGKRDVDFLAARVAGDSPVPAEGWIPKGQDMFQILEVNAVVNGQNWLRAYGDGWIITELHGSVPQYFFEYNNFMVCQVIGNIKTAIGGALAVAEAQYATGHISVTGNLYSYNIVGKDDTITTNDSTIEWDYSNSDFNVYDEVQTVRLSGKDGHADVKFVVMTDARRVGISITALDIDGKDSIYMYGDITATATILGESRSFKLFTIGDREEIHWTVDKGDEIPGPWALAIPMKQKKVRIELELYRSIRLWPDTELIHDSATLSPESPSSTLKGKNGKFRIDTTWS